MKLNKIYFIKKLYYYSKKGNSFFFFLFFAAYILYYLSLEKCYEGFDLCSLKTSWIKKKIKEVVIFCLIILLMIELIFYRIISALNVIHLSFFYFLIYLYSHGIDFDDHGYYNFFGSIAIIIILLLIISPINILLYIIKLNNKLYCLIFVMILLIIWALYCFIANYYMNCDDWKYGLNNTIIENDMNKHGCKIIFPKTCPYKLGKYIFDKSKITKFSCGRNIDTKEKLIEYSHHKYINEKTKRVGFPLTNKNKLIHMGYSNNNLIVKKFFKDYIIDIDNKTLFKTILKMDKPETIVDYNTNQFGELKINLKFNKTLSKERKNLENNTTPYSKNIIIIFIDSVSRVYSIRSLKKTLKFFEQFMQYKGSHNKKYPNENFHSFQFFKYHSFFYYTRYNYPQIFYGKLYGKLERNIKFLKENGYVTCYINDMCHREPTNTEHNMTKNEISDHEYLICDPNTKALLSSLKRCLYNKITAEYAFEYGTQFLRKYKENRKYLSINLQDGHEGTLEVLKYTDNIIYKFLNNLYDNHLLINTSIFLVSDHGTACPSPYHLNKFFSIERYLPMFYLICNDRKNLSYEEQYLNIRNNQQILITGYDIYNTLANLVFGDKYDFIKNKTEDIETPKSKFGLSLFNKINSKMRIPKNYENMTRTICIA